MFKTICASAHSIPLPPKSVHQIITSPPYYGLRSYAGEQGLQWPTVRYSPMPGLPEIEVPAMTCGLGQEPTIEAYIGHLILCLREWRRILRDDGTCFVNLGDSYNSGSSGSLAGSGLTGGQSNQAASNRHGKKVAKSIAPKNLCLIPERFRLAAQADGWIVRSAFNWIKVNALPESVTDRPGNSHESWVMLTKSQRYYWDGEAIKKEAVVGYAGSTFTNGKTASAKAGLPPVGQGERQNQDGANGRNRRTADWMFESIDHAIEETKRWLAHAEHVREHQGLLLDDEDHPLAMPVNLCPFPGAHFAAFPPGVVEPLILAGTSQKGCCAACSKPWERWSIGWAQACACPPSAPIPCTILDPFVGSGTALEVATALGRDSVGVDISQEYLDNVLPIRFQDGVQIGFQF